MDACIIKSPKLSLSFSISHSLTLSLPVCVIKFFTRARVKDQWPKQAHRKKALNPKTRTLNPKTRTLNPMRTDTAPRL